MYTVKTLLPFVNWDNPANVSITINTGCNGGIRGHQLYMSDDKYAVCRALKMCIDAGKSVYIPTNQTGFATSIVDFCKYSLGLEDDKVILFNKDSPDQLWIEMIDEPTLRLGYDDDLQPIPDHTQVRVLVATPAFGVGFSVP